MWADVVLDAERRFALALAIWAITVGLVSLLVITWTARRGSSLGVVRGFGVASAGLATLELLAALARLHDTALRDVAATARLEHLVWLALGMSVGVGVAGACVIFTARRLRVVSATPRGDADVAMGAGTALGLHGIALAFLLAHLASAIVSR